MKSPKPGGKLKRWRVSILRARAHNPGTIEAPDAKAAEAEAVKLFGLDEEQRKRLSVWERDSDAQLPPSLLAPFALFLEPPGTRQGARASCC